MANPLRYNISNWGQLTQCKSNNSVDLYISVKHIIDDGTNRLAGTVISVNHATFGALFTCLVDSRGTILTPDSSSGIIKEFTTDEILGELEKFGFLVTFKINQHLSGAQISYLLTLDGLGFDKIRKLSVVTTDKSGTTSISDYLVGFMVEQCPDWLSSNYQCPKAVFLEKLDQGVAINFTHHSMAQQYDWTWLTYVANISDILRDNGYADAIEGEVDGNE